MIVTLEGRIEFELDSGDIDEVEVDFGNAFDDINESIDELLADEQYVNEIFEDVNSDGKKLNKIIEVYVDPDYAGIKLDVADSMTDEEIIEEFKPILENILINADTSANVICSGVITRDSWNYMRDEYDEESSYESWDDTVYLKDDIEKCRVIREEDK